MCQNTGKIIQICILCGKSSTDRSNMRKHVENIHFPGHYQYSCQSCDEVFDGRNKLYLHISRRHKALEKIVL